MRANEFRTLLAPYTFCQTVERQPSDGADSQIPDVPPGTPFATLSRGRQTNDRTAYLLSATLYAYHACPIDLPHRRGTSPIPRRDRAERSGRCAQIQPCITSNTMVSFGYGTITDTTEFDISTSAVAFTYVKSVAILRIVRKNNRISQT